MFRSILKLARPISNQDKIVVPIVQQLTAKLGIAPPPAPSPNNSSPTNIAFLLSLRENLSSASAKKKNFGRIFTLFVETPKFTRYVKALPVREREKEIWHSIVLGAVGELCAAAAAGDKGMVCDLVCDLVKLTELASKLSFPLTISNYSTILRLCAESSENCVRIEYVISIAIRNGVETNEDMLRNCLVALVEQEKWR